MTTTAPPKGILPHTPASPTHASSHPHAAEHVASSPRTHAQPHAHGHHHHAPPSGGAAFAIAIALNIAIVIAEVVGGMISGSIALIADAGHNFVDVLALVLAWVATRLASRPASARYTYGLKSVSILAALANATLLWVALGAILFETLRRLADPGPIAGGLVIAIAAGGIVGNGLSALLLARGAKQDLNRRAAFQHFLADAMVSVGVVVAGAAVLWTGWRWIDPLAGLIVIVAIGAGSWGILRESLDMGLLAVPRSVDEAAVRAHLAAQPGVVAVHDLHIWPMSTTETALTAHLVMPDGCPGDTFLHGLAHAIEHDFAIGHATLQVERGDGDCALHRHVIGC